MRTGALLALTAALASWPLAGAASPEPRRPARALVDEAMAAARAQDKNVLVVFGASWCGPCRELERFFGAADVAPILTTHFVLVHLAVSEDDPTLENAGADDVKEQLGDGSGAIPFYCFIDGEGQKLADSRTPHELGILHRPAQIAAFDALLARVAPRMTSGEHRRIQRRLVVMAAQNAWWKLRHSPRWQAFGVAGSALALAGCLLGWLVLKRMRQRRAAVK